MTTERKFELAGHRGARGLFPENTLEGFAATLALGVDAIELDVALTADGIPVVTHDSRLNAELTRGPDGAWLAGPGPAIRSLRLADLQPYDVGRLRPGSRTARLHPAQTPQDGARIPTLASVIALAGQARVRVDAEVKTQPDEPGLTAPAAEVADAVLAAAAQAGATELLVVRSFDWRGLRHLRRTRPELPLVWLTSPHTVARAALWWDGATPAAHGGSVPAAIAAEYAGRPVQAGWAPEHAGLTRAEIAAAQALGLRVLPWTVNDPADMERLIAWGVDGLCTDRPDLARAAMHAAGLPLPRARAS
jgi:glycerophosphoryl diester phosphodiesterase